MITRWCLVFMTLVVLTGCVAPEKPKIVYVSPQETRLGEIYVMNEDGSQPTRLTYFSPNQEQLLSFPRWSPDGENIAFLAQPLERNIRHGYDLYVMQRDGSNLQQLATGVYSYFSWAPNSQQLAYVAESVHLLDINTQENITVTTMPLAPEEVYWSPAGDYLLVWGKQNDQLDWYVMDLTGQNIQRLPIDFTDRVVWMSDGQGILFAQFIAATNANELFIYNLADGQILPLVTAETFQPYGTPVALWPLNSPDGQHIAFISREVDGRVLYVIDRDGTNLRRLAKESINDDIFTMTWSPDNQTIAYESADTLKTINIETGETQQLVYFETWFTEPNWSLR